MSSQDIWMPMREAYGEEETPKEYNEVRWGSFPHASKLEINPGALERVQKKLLFPRPMTLNAISETKNKNVNFLPDESGTALGAFIMDEDVQKPVIKKTPGMYIIEINADTLTKKADGNIALYSQLLNADVKYQIRLLKLLDQQQFRNEYGFGTFDSAILALYSYLIASDVYRIIEATHGASDQYIFGPAFDIVFLLGILTLIGQSKKQRILDKEKRGLLSEPKPAVIERILHKKYADPLLLTPKLDLSVRMATNRIDTNSYIRPRAPERD